jgi:hypothetical protein
MKHGIDHKRKSVTLKRLNEVHHTKNLLIFNKKEEQAKAPVEWSKLHIFDKVKLFNWWSLA